MMCIRICNNLSKSLIVFHDASVPDRFLVDDIVYASVDLAQSNHIKQIAFIETKLRRDSLYTSQVQNGSAALNKNIATLRKSVHETDTITNVLEYIEKHYAGTLRERDVAEHCHLSIPYFSRLFHQEIGESFRDYVSNKRISLAKQLLKDNPRQQISAIAYQCGFNDVSYFSRMFKKKTGMSPGTYRNIGGTLDLAQKD
jgi:YesN/AraC family two-component response regulator